MSPVFLILSHLPYGEYQQLIPSEQTQAQFFLFMLIFSKFFILENFKPTEKLLENSTMISIHPTSRFTC